MEKPRVVSFGDAVHCVKLEGNPKKPEKAHFRVAFPGGDIEVVRTPTDDYWVHVRVNKKQAGDYIKGEILAQIVDARLDIYGRHSSDVNIGELYHLAVRIQRIEE